MTLSTRIIITGILKKTKVKMFGNADIGDLIVIKMQLSKPGRGGHGGLYASYLICDNYNKHESCVKSISELSNILKNFEYREI